MNKDVKRIVILTIILAILMISGIVCACITKEGKIMTASYIIPIGFIIYPMVDNLSKNIESFMKRLTLIKKCKRKKVYKKKALPIYSINLKIPSIFLLLAIIWLTYKHNILSYIEALLHNDMTIYCIFLLFLALLIYFIKKRQAKMLYLIKDEPKICYYSSLSNVLFLHFIDIYTKLKSSSNEKQYDLSEYIETTDGIKFCSHFTIRKFFDHSYIEHGYHRHEYLSYIFASLDFVSSEYINIELSNKLDAYVCANCLIPSKYSNLQVYSIAHGYSEIICEKIDKKCSDFFARTRRKYFFCIKHGQILLGLSYARFGKYSRLFNTRKTKKLTQKAIEDISKFLLDIKTTIENVDYD